LKPILTGSAHTIVDLERNRLTVFDLPENLARLDDFVKAFDRPSHLESKVFQLQYAMSAEIMPQIQGLLTPAVGKVVSDPKTNQLIITDLPPKLDKISHYVSSLDRKTQEVYIEARIIQVSLTDALKLGVNWQAFTDKIEELGPVELSSDFNVLSSSDQALRFSSGLLSEKNYRFILEALSEVGTTDLLSSPHITAVNNKESRILVGSSIPYKTIDTREENGAIRTFERVTVVEVGVKLYVTPTINDSNYVRLKIKPEVSSVTGFSDGIPVVEKTEAETEVLIRDGVTLIIGGLIKNETRSTVKKIPLLGDIPLLGKVFSSTDRQVVKSELIIFITPHIISGDITQARGAGN
jgi:type II secretory pathway component GspD/PulD (secretin)